MHSATVRLEFPDAATASCAAMAVGPELDDGPGGSTARIIQEGPLLVLEATASELSDLRAVLNNTVRLLDAAGRTATPDA